LLLIVFVNVKLTLTYVMIFVFGFLDPVRLNLGFIYSSEAFKDKHSPVMGSLMLSFDALTYIITVIYFSQISNEWRPLFYFYLILAAIPVLISYSLPESPRYLMSKRLYIKARQSFNKIATINQKNELCPQTEKFQQELDYLQVP